MIPLNDPADAQLKRGWLARTESAKSQHARANDPLTLAVTKVRALFASQGEAEEEVRRAWDAENAPVLTPLPSRMHPQVAARVLAVLSDAGFDDFDWLAPLVVPDTGSLEQRIAEAVAAEKAAYQKASDELLALEARYKAYERFVKAGPLGFDAPDVDDEDEPEPVRLAPEPAEDEPALPDEPVKRGRGRPPRVILDEDEPILPDQ